MTQFGWYSKIQSHIASTYSYVIDFDSWYKCNYFADEVCCMPVKVTYKFVYLLVPLQVFVLKNITKYDIHRLKTDL